MPAEEHDGNFRTHCAMVLFALEECLVTYLRGHPESLENVPENVVGPMRERAGPHHDKAPGSVLAMLNDLYLDDLFQLGSTLPHRPAHETELLKQLYARSQSLEILAVRNSVCHPARRQRIPSHFWYKTAVLATDEAVSALGFTKVTEALCSAERGELRLPPEDWLRQRIWSIPNNLPEQFEHQVTGLLGRGRELKDLDRKLRQPRNTSMAIVAPGGVGKTSLCLEALRRLAVDPAAASVADAVIFVTAATQRLTPSGVIAVTTPIVTLNGVEDAIAEALDVALRGDRPMSFDEHVTNHSNKRLIIAIDNLETLLRDGPDAFYEFQESMPRDWKIVVTSRIRVNASAIIPLAPLDAVSAEQLVRQYTRTRTGTQLSDNSVASIVRSAHGNGLALRLMADACLAGSTITDSIATTEASVLEFSYRALLQHLPSLCSDILEAMFVVHEKIDRISLASLLECDPDDIADALIQLSDTSLVVSGDDETASGYVLTESTRSLLTASPRSLVIRERVRKQLALERLREQAQEREASQSSLAFARIDASIVGADKSLLVRAFGLNSSNDREELLSTHRQLTARLGVSPRFAAMHRALAHVLLLLADQIGAMSHLLQAKDTAEADDALLLRLAELLLHNQRVSDATDILGGLWSKYIESPVADAMSNEYELQRLATEYFKALTFTGRLQDVKNMASTWARRDCLRVPKAAAFISSTRRLAQPGVVSSPADRLACITDALQCSEAILEEDGYVGSVVHESMNLLGDVCGYLEEQLLGLPILRVIERYLGTHLAQLCQSHKRTRLNDPSIAMLVRALKSQGKHYGERLLDSPIWNRLVAPRSSEGPWIRTVVYSRPRSYEGSLRGFLFTRGQDGTEYYVQRRATGLLVREFETIALDDELWVVPDPIEAVSGTAKNVLRASLTAPIEAEVACGESRGEVRGAVSDSRDRGDTAAFDSDDGASSNGLSGADRVMIEAKIVECQNRAIIVDGTGAGRIRMKNIQTLALCAEAPPQCGTRVMMIFDMSTSSRTQGTLLRMRPAKSDLLPGNLVRGRLVAIGTPASRPELFRTVQPYTQRLGVAIVEDIHVVLIDLTPRWMQKEQFACGEEYEVEILHESTRAPSVFRGDLNVGDIDVQTLIAEKREVEVIVTGVQSWCVTCPIAGVGELDIGRGGLRRGPTEDLRKYVSIGDALKVVLTGYDSRGHVAGAIV